MALTQIRGEQIRDGIIKDRHISSDAAVSYSKLDLAGQVVASDLNGDGSVEDSALDSKLLTLWDMVQSIQSGTGSSVGVTTEVLASAAVDTPQTGLTAKGVLLTGTGTNGAGTTNYRVQLRDATTGEPISDGTDEDAGLAVNASSIYAELRHDGSDYTLYFFDSNDQAYTFGSDVQIDFLFLEIFSYLTAPAKGFITGVGFADVVGIQGSHNHHDLYYTQTDLNAGQLDNRYYTETELNNGQLDNRYYTETELDPTAAATGDNVLDARFFRETELASSGSGSAGASLIGVDAADVTGLDATTVQTALAELQGDINDITSGSINITHSMNDAYDDGSIVTIDNSNVDFQITDTKAFKVSDSAGVAIVEVDALSAGDTLDVIADTTIVGNTDITGTFDVVGASTLDAVTVDGNLSQSGGSVTLNGGANAVDIDGGAITIDGSAITLASTGALVLKDQFLTVGIPASETGVTGLSGVDATSIVGAINETASELTTLIDTTLPSLTDGSSGADQIGVTGITGILPEGGTVGADATLQAMLEGIAKSSGGVTTFADEAAFTTSKSNGDYLPVGTLIMIEDTNRFIEVNVEGTAVAEGTDYDYLWDASNPMGGVSFKVSSPTTIAGNTDITGTFDVVGASTLDAVTVDGNLSQSGGSVTLNSNSTLDLDATGAATIDASSITLTSDVDTDIVATTSGQGEIRLTSSKEVDIDAPFVQFHGDVVIPESNWLDVGNISITSVDPSDQATISGSRSGTANVANILINGGFESGSGVDADNWVEGSIATRVDQEKYYGSYAMHFIADDVALASDILTQVITGLTPSTAHTIKFWVKGSTGGDIQVQLPSGAAVSASVGAQQYTDWTQLSINTGTDNTADGNFRIIAAGSGTEDYDLYIDAVSIFEGEDSIESFFTEYKSELVFTIGDEDNDQIVFRSAGTATQDLLTIKQNEVEILGNLIVSGTTTTVNSSVIDIAEQKMTLNVGQTSPILDASLEVDRGSGDNVAIKWNETTDKWELTNDGITFSAIVTSGAGGALSMDQAYDGGSAVTVDTTDVDFTLGTGRDFTIADGTDASKFVIKAGTDTDSIKMSTSGGIDIDMADEFNIYGSAHGSVFQMSNTGAITVNSNGTGNLNLATSGGDLKISATSNGGVDIVSDTSTDIDAISIDATTGGIDINAGLGITIDASGISLDSDAASNFTIDGANLTLNTITSGNVILSSAGALTASAAASSAISVTGADLALSTITSGNILLESAGTLSLEDTNLSTGIAISESGVTGLSGYTATSIVGALNEIKSEASSANTMDEIYDGESASDRIVTVDDGSVEFRLTDTNEFNLADSTGIDIVSIKALATGDILDVNASIDIDGELVDINATGTSADAVKVISAGGVAINSAEGIALSDDSGNQVQLNIDGSLDLHAASGQIASLATVGGASISTNATEADITATTIDINGNVDIDGSTVDIDTTNAISFDAAANSNFSVASANLTFETSTAGNVIISSAAEVNIDGSSISIDGTAASNFSVTGNNVTLSTLSSGNVILSSASELIFTDSRATAIPFSDVSNISLPGSATSILGALKIAYEKSIDMGYEEKTATSTDVTNDYVVLSDTAGVLPDSGITFPAAPSALRGAGYHVAAYLNGLRLSDTEWRYNYSTGTKSITFDGSDDITLVSGDKIMVEVKKIS